MQKIELSGIKGKGKFALVDDEYYEEFSKYKWFLHTGGYAYKGNDKKTYMHREIMENPEGRIIDHKNHNKLDNRKENLRVCTHYQNNVNRTPRSTKSGFAGVWKNAKCSTYQVVIRANGVRRYIGSYKTMDEALIAREKAVKSFHGEFAYSL